MGSGRIPQKRDKSELIQDAFAAMTGGKYPRIKAAVFWHERWQNKDESWSNLRVQVLARRVEGVPAGGRGGILDGSSVGSRKVTNEE